MKYHGGNRMRNIDEREIRLLRGETSFTADILVA